MSSIFKGMSKSNKNDIMSSEILNVSINNGIIKIEVLDNCSIQRYCMEIENKIPEDIRNKIASSAILDNWPNLNKKTIYLLEKENLLYCISIEDFKINISEKIDEGSFIKEKIVDFNELDKKYSICMMVHDSNHSTIDVKNYSSSESINDDTISYFHLERGIALEEIKLLLNNLETIKDINNIIDISKIYACLDVQVEKVKKFSYDNF